MTHSDTPEIEYPECDGEGFTMKRLPRVGGGLYEVNCEACNGMGWRAMTEDEEADAAEEQHRLMCEGEAPMSMQEAYEAAFRQKQELRS